MIHTNGIKKTLLENNMIVVRLKGGLGNQMFQYALGRVLSTKYNVELRLDMSFFELGSEIKRSYSLDVFNIEAKIASKSDIPFIFKLSKNRFIIYLISLSRRIMKVKDQEKRFNFDPNILSIGPDAYLDGYWQSPKYFADYKDVIRKDFTLKNPPSEEVQKLGNEISNINSGTLADFNI